MRKTELMKILLTASFAIGAVDLIKILSYSAADFFLVVPHKIKINRGSRLFGEHSNKLQS